MDDPVNAALFVQQAKGRPKMAEIAEVLDDLIAQRCASIRAAAKVRAVTDIDWERWGRITYVLEETLALIRRLDADEEVRTFLRRKMRDGERRSTTQTESADGDSRQP